MSPVPAGPYTGPVVAADDVATYMGASLDDESIAQVHQAIDAEEAAQRRACQVPYETGDYPADLTQALIRRVVVSVAKAGIPLGVQFDAATGGGMRMSTIDAEVRRLEAPYRKLPIG